MVKEEMLRNWKKKSDLYYSATRTKIKMGKLNSF
jgi:hypothetical protein